MSVACVRRCLQAVQLYGAKGEKQSIGISRATGVSSGRSGDSAYWDQQFAVVLVGPVPRIPQDSFLEHGEEQFLHCDRGCDLDRYSFSIDRSHWSYGTRTYPVTYRVIDLIREDVSFFLLIIIAYFSGAMVWKDRERRMDEIVDATPAAEWTFFAARLASLVGIVMMVQAVALAAGTLVQAASGYHRFQLGFVAYELFVRDASTFLFLSFLAFFLHVLAPNKYLGIFSLRSLLLRQRLCLAGTERRNQPCSVCGTAQGYLFLFLRRRPLSPGVELVHALLAAFLPAPRHRHGDGLATGKARRSKNALPQRRFAADSKMEGNRHGLPAGFRWLRRVDLVQHQRLTLSGL